MILQALGAFAALSFALTVAAWFPKWTLPYGVLAYLGLTFGAFAVGFGALKAGEFLGERLLRLASFERFADRTIGGSRMTTAICILAFIPGWCGLTAFAAHALGCDPYLGIPLVTVAWLLTQWAVLLVALPVWIVVGLARGDELVAW